MKTVPGEDNITQQPPQQFLEQVYPPEGGEPQAPPPQAPPAQPQELAYPMPGDRKTPLKIDGTQLEAIIIVPKGAQVTYPRAEQPPASPPPPPAPDAEKEQMRTENQKLQDELKALKKANEDREAAERKVKAEAIADIRISKGLTTADKKEDLVKELEQLPMNTLAVLEADTKKLEAVTVTPLPQTTEPTTDDRNLSEKEKKKKELRKQMFGHEEPADEFYKDGKGDN